MFKAHSPANFWAKAVATATYLKNYLPTKSLHFKAPLETLQTHTTIPSILYLLEYLVVLYMFTSPNKLETHIILVLLNVFLLGME